MLRDQETLCWGADDFRQCAAFSRCDDAAACDTGPVSVPGLSGALGVALGTHHTCAIDGANEVRCWGSNSDGELGSAVPEGCKMGQSPAPECVLPPTVVAGLTDVRTLALGESHSCAVAGPSDAVYCWGSNDKWQLGHGKYPAPELPEPVLTDTNPPTALEGVVSLVTRGDYSCATIRAGGTFCWGTLYALNGEIVQTSGLAVPLSFDGL
jgi:alpha-tubulin suppressor-like RCC1 family protein